MAISIEIEERARFSSPASKRLQSAARSSIGDFFRKHEAPPETVHITVFKASSGADPEKIIKLLAGKSPEMGVQSGIPVLIFTEGHQGLNCLMTIPGQNEQSVIELIEQGPYNRKPRRKLLALPREIADSFGVMATLASSALTEATEDNPAPAAEDTTDVEEATKPTAEAKSGEKPPVRRLAPLEKLLANGVNGDEIERLKTTIASIIYRKVGESEIPPSELLMIPVEEITKAIMEHMRLPMNDAGNYRGIIGNFYAAKISLFALKWDDSADPDAQYTDWCFDCDLALDFIGGRSKLAALTRERDVEVSKRIARERDAAANPPVKAEAVQEVARQGFLQDAALLELARSMLDGRHAAEEAMHLAEMNAAKLLDEVAGFEARLAAAKTAHEKALTQVGEAREKIAEYVLDNETLERIRAAKARLDSLALELGL